MAFPPETGRSRTRNQTAKGLQSDNQRALISEWCKLAKVAKAKSRKKQLVSCSFTMDYIIGGSIPDAVRFFPFSETSSPALGFTVGFRPVGMAAGA